VGHNDPEPVTRFTPSTNLDVVREGYARFNARDLDWVMDHVDEEITWVDAPEIPDARTYRGAPEVRHYLESIHRNWEHIRFEPQELHEEGDAIVASCRLEGRGLSSGAEVDASITHVWRLRNLRVLSIETYFDPRAAAAALRADEPGE
jgi:ketosteroid isomerase-like protein